MTRTLETNGQILNLESDPVCNSKPEQQFRETLKAILEAAGIDSSEPIRLQMGREVVLKGTLDDPTVNKLSPSRLALLNRVLDLAANGDASNEASGARGVINLDVGNHRLLRMEGGEVKINELQPMRLEAQAQHSQAQVAALEALTETIWTKSADELKQIVPQAPESFEDYRSSWKAVDQWVRSALGTNAELQTFAQKFTAQVENVAGRLLERQFAAAEAVVSSVTTPLRQEPVAMAGLLVQNGWRELNTAAELFWIDQRAKQELREFDQKLNPQPRQNLLQTVAAPVADMASGWTQKLTVPAAAVALKELYSSNLAPTAQDWAKRALSGLHQAARLVSENLPERTLDLSGKVMNRISEIPTELRMRQMADTVVKLTKTLGTVQDASKFIPDASPDRKTFGVDTGNFKIHVRNTHLYVVNNAMGDEIMRFRQTALGPKFSCCQPNAMEQRDLLQAHRHLTPELANASAQTIVAKLGNLAPVEQQKEARTQQIQQIVDRVHRRLDRAVAEGNATAENRHYRLEQHADGSRTLTLKGAQQPKLTIGTDGGVKSYMHPEDFERLMGQPQKTKQLAYAKGVER